MSRFLLTLLLYSFIHYCTAQIILNEASSRNASLYVDGKDYTDIIEIYNTSNTAVNLNNWYLSDNRQIPLKWRFFSETLAANDYVVIFADGDNINSGYFPNTKQHTNFKLNVNGDTLYLSNASAQIIDSLIIPRLEINQSVGKAMGTTTGQVFFHKMTPDTANYTSAYSFKGGDAVVIPSAGFYTNSVSVACFCSAGETAVYTINGDIPDTNSTIYAAPLTFTSTTVLKVRCLSSTQLPGSYKTNTYFINENSSVPVISLSIDTAHLFDWNTGIWVAGPNAAQYLGANYYRGWRRPCKVEYFKNNVKIFGKDAAISNEGQSSLSAEKKSIRLNFNHSTLGNNSINYAMFPEKPQIISFKNLKLRQGGNVYVIPASNGGGGIMYHDAVVESFVKKLNVAYAASIPASLFVNGKYWGLYDVRERQDDHYYSTNYGAVEDSVEESSPNSGFPYFTQIKYDSISNYIYSAPDKISDTFYNHAAGLFDYSNLRDYYCSQLFFNNTDWINSSYTSNQKLWRDASNTSDKKFRFTFYDLDYSFCNASWPINALQNLMYTGAIANITKIPRGLLQHPTFKKDFINRYADLINYHWQQDSIQQGIDAYQTMVQNEITRECSRWPFNNVTRWMDAYNTVRNCVVDRTISARKEIDTLLANNAGQVNITIDASPTGAGSVKISTLTFAANSLPWTGSYFKGNEVPLQAIPEPGFVFSHWETVAPITDTTAKNIDTFFLQNAVTLRAVFVPGVPFSISSLNITATQKNCIDIIEWSNALDSEVEKYELWQRINNKFEKIAATESQSNNKHLYRFATPSQSKNTAYYKLCLLKKNNNSTETNILSIANKCSNNSISIFPNPAHSELTVALKSSNSCKMKSIDILDVSGKIQLKKNMQIGSTNNCTLDISNLPSGHYSIIATTSCDESVIEPFFINR